MGAIISKATTPYGAYQALCQCWFFVTFSATVIGSGLATRFMNFVLFFLDVELRKRMSRQMGGLFFRVLFLLNPQIKIVADDGGSVSDVWAAFQKSREATDKRPAFIMQNHTSNLDPLLFSATMPLSEIKHTSTMAKAGLFKVPFFGRMIKDCGHFPVYFSSAKQGSFQVDREQQTKVMDDVKVFVDNGGHLSFYPEGQINQGSVLELQPFRRGSFALAQKHDMELWAFLMIGASDCWPKNEFMGGLPCTIRISMFKSGEKSGGEYADTTELADSLRDILQKSLGEVNARNDTYLASKGGAKAIKKE